jgi:hypothetical protein
MHPRHLEEPVAFRRLDRFPSMIAATHRVPGAIWSLGKTLVGNAVAAPGVTARPL